MPSIAVAIGGAHAAWRLDAARRHSVAVRSAAAVGGQLMCWRLAGWCVRLQCHRRATTRMRRRLAAATARRIQLPCDQQREPAGGGLLVGAFDCSAIGELRRACGGSVPRHAGARLAGVFDCRAISSTSQRAADVLAACWLVRSIAVPSASCGAHAVAASCRHGKARSIAVCDRRAATRMP